MSKLARAFVLAATLAAMNLAGLTAVAQAQATDEPASNQDVRRPPTERQVGQPYRNYHEALAAQAQTAADDATQRALAEKWNYYYQSTRVPPAELKAWMQAQKQPTIADDTQRPPTEAEVGESWRHPVNVPVRPAEPIGHPVSLVAWLGLLAAVLALAAGLAVLAVRRAGRKVQVGQAA